MDEHKPELSEIVSRMERIEKENRRLKQAALVVMLVAGLIVLVGVARPTPDIIRAQKFVVVNVSGKEQAVLETHALQLYDYEGVKRVDLGTDSVLVQPEMERTRCPLVSIPPFRRGFSRHWGLPIR